MVCTYLRSRQTTVSEMILQHDVCQFFVCKQPVNMTFMIHPISVRNIVIIVKRPFIYEIFILIALFQTKYYLKRLATFIEAIYLHRNTYGSSSSNRHIRCIGQNQYYVMDRASYIPEPGPLLVTYHKEKEVLTIPLTWNLARLWLSRRR